MFGEGRYFEPKRAGRQAAMPGREEYVGDASEKTDRMTKSYSRKEKAGPPNVRGGGPAKNSSKEKQQHNSRKPRWRMSAKQQYTV
ncbi:hypothetical protein [Oxalicibacterium solurbis]|uniref:hypothetical protein n=1 Tax=Oxalicibacterium solurbis TaxID=69280 RepID=UPI00166D005A|nr:hypothetical protein [Oxalicibacterium solurbis]